MNFYMRITGSRRGLFSGNSTRLNRVGWIEIVECPPETLGALGLAGGSSEKITVTKVTGTSSPTFFRSAYDAGAQLGTGSDHGFGAKGGSGGGGSGSHGGKHPIVITKKADSATPQLMLACATGESFAEFLLDVTGSLGSGMEGPPTRLSLYGARIVGVRTCLRPTVAIGTLSHDFFLHFQECRQVPTA